MDEIVIVGGGHAGAQLCGVLAQAGLGPRIHLVCQEEVLPYQRPPLSKSYQKSPEEGLQWLRGQAWYAEQGVTLHLGDPAVSIDRQAHVLTLASGRSLHYQWLALATGTRARHLPHLTAPLENVHLLRTAADAERLRAAWPGMRHLDVVGGGFIGLEVAATARALGKSVRVLESAPRLMQRAVSPELSQHVLGVHRASGIEIETGVAVGRFEMDGRRLVALHAGDRRFEVDALLLGVGAVPEHGLASPAGLDCENGIVVDAHMCTSDAAILAIGDCTAFPEPTTGRRLRLESVQNAHDQAKAAAATMLGSPAPYRALPWFWSEQGSMRLQMAGLLPEGGESHRRPGGSDASFSILHYVAGRLACVESVNAPIDHVAARKLFESGRSPDPADACDPGKALKQFASP